MNMALKSVLVIALALLAVGCASHRTRVSCDGHLKPINPPAAAKSGSAHP
jgi:hypothetical protein